jgi:hypothetical protein
LVQYRDLDFEYATDLVKRQETLQIDAQEVIHELEIVTRLGEVGQVFQIGSLVSGLMVWRDIDFSIVCRDATPPEIFEAMAPIAGDRRVRSLHFENETGDRSPSGRLEDDRLYFVLRYQPPDGSIWKIDFSFWFSETGRTEIMHPHQLRDQLTEETRLAILWLKDMWQHSPTYPEKVSGPDIYEAVLKYGVRSPQHLRAHLHKRGLPVD